MKNKRWLRLTGWLLALIMILTVMPVATFAEADGEVNSDTIKSPTMQKRPAEVDVTAVFTYTNASGKATEPAKMNPNETNQMKLVVSGLNDRNEIGKDTVMAVTLPEDITVLTTMQEFSSDAVSATLDDGKLLLSWKGEKLDSFEATVAVLPHLPTENDLSGDYVLGTKGNQNYKVMLGTTAFNDSGNANRKRLSGTAFDEVDGRVNLPSDAAAAVWHLEHVSGDYYTVRSNENGLYLRIDDKNNGLILENATHLTAQKLLVQNTGNGYYSFAYNKKSINNSSFNADKGFASYNYETGGNAILKLYAPSAVVRGDKLIFSVNGGTGDNAPEMIIAEPGTTVTLPDLNAAKNGQEFLGWADVNNIYAKASNASHTYHEVYLPGASYTVRAGTNTLYAVYNATNRNVQFGIRKDGVIVDEPNDNSVSDYIGHFTVNGILKVGHWVIDINSTKPVNGYYVENNVIAALNWVPSAEEIAAALKKEGKVDFDPETQYIHYYVLKYAGGKWKIDGVIRNKASVEITYNVNVPVGIDKTKVSNMPGSYQIASGTEILIGTEKNSQEVKTPAVKNYVFTGWNTEPDGSGKDYSAGNYVRLGSNLNLYAQWASVERNLIITLDSSWPQDKPAPSGTMITLTATLYGFDGLVEGEDYYLQWQYSLDAENWIDETGANEIVYTYELNAKTAQYTWRVVARDVK